MRLDDLKEFNGRKYMGVSVGGRHVWHYPNGTWKEQKVTPDVWVFEFESEKHRRNPAPMNSGAPVGTQYHWYILADQRVRKIDKDTYETSMEGVKFKISHKRPQWRKWSSEYPDNTPDKERILRILEDVAQRLKEARQSEYRDAASAYLGAFKTDDDYPSSH